MINSEVKHIEASAAVYRVNEDSNVFEFRSADQALRYSGPGLTKTSFQRVHNGSAEQAEQDRLLQAYDVDLATFRSSLRTVGVGSNIIIKEQASGSIVIPMVGRTDSGPDGTVALGKQSRAAGGAYGDISLSGLRELSEEFIFAHDKGDKEKIIILNPVYNEASLDPSEARLIREAKNKKALSILQEYGLPYSSVDFRDLKATVLGVPGLTEDITQIVDGDFRIVEKRVLTDNPEAGDFAGVDTILYVELPDNISLEATFVKDGEENFEGQLLKREWSMKTPQEWRRLIDNGMPISPAPKRVFDNWNKVERALHISM